MDLKNLMSHVVRPVVNRTTKGELSAPELAQLSEEDLQQIIGGIRGSGGEFVRVERLNQN
jgi:bacteriocin-like protein